MYVLYVCMCVCVCSLTFCLIFCIICKKLSLVLKKYGRYLKVRKCTWMACPWRALASFPFKLQINTGDQIAKTLEQVSTGPRSPEISTFYTIIKQWEFDHFELLDFCVPSNSTSSDSNSTSGSGSEVCTHRTYSVAKGFATMYVVCVQRSEQVNVLGMSYLPKLMIKIFYTLFLAILAIFTHF